MIIGIHRSHGYFSSCLAHSHRFSQASKTEVYVANKHDRLRCRRTQEARKLKITCKADTKEKSVIKIFVCPFQEQTAPAKHNSKKNTLVTTQVTSLTPYTPVLAPDYSVGYSGSLEAREYKALPLNFTKHVQKISRRIQKKNIYSPAP